MISYSKELVEWIIFERIDFSYEIIEFLHLHLEEFSRNETEE